MTKASEAWKRGEFQYMSMMDAGGGVFDVTVLTCDGKRGTFKVKDAGTGKEKILSDSDIK